MGIVRQPSGSAVWMMRLIGLSVNVAHAGPMLPRDAALSAWAAREGLADSWIDIIGADADLLFPAGPVRYLWPKAAVSFNRRRGRNLPTSASFPFACRATSIATSPAKCCA